MMRGISAIWWMLAITVCLGGNASVFADSKKPAAIVNGEPILMSEVDAVLGLRPKELFPVPQAQQKQARLEILDGLIGERLMRQFLAQRAVPVDAADVDRQMAALVTAQKAVGKSLADFCRETRQSEAQVRTSVQNMLQFSAFAKSQSTTETLKKYYEANLDYFQKVTVRCSHIVLRLPLEATELERQEARKRLGEIRQKLLAKQIGFAEAAKEYSQCPSAPKGGDIGYITRKWMVDEPVALAAFSLKKGELSDIVVSEFGLHLIHVTDRTDPRPMEFAACIDDVRDCYIEELRQQLLTDLRKRAKIEILIR